MGFFSSFFHEKSKLSRQTLPQPKKSNKLYPDEYRRIMENMHPCPVKKSQSENNYSDRKIEINLFYCEKSPFFGPPTPKNLLFERKSVAHSTPLCADDFQFELVYVPLCSFCIFYNHFLCADWFLSQSNWARMCCWTKKYLCKLTPGGSPFLIFWLETFWNTLKITKHIKSLENLFQAKEKLRKSLEKA